MSALVTIGVKRPGRIDRGVEVDATIAEMLGAGAVVAIGVSGGKDSCAAAIATVEYLRGIQFAGTIVLVHADLGDKDPSLDVEWADSLPTCERLAAQLGLELIVVRRKAGGMMKRWHKRWSNNVARYIDLRCVRVILPWSTPSMRFCTSELKSAPIASALVKRFPGQPIISACGIRREEGNGKDNSPRTNAPTSEENTRLTSKRWNTFGVNWNPIAAWTEGDVFAYCASHGFQMHEGYALGMKRISCVFCIMQGQDDQRIAASILAHVPLFRTVARLEIDSTFGFQGSHWLADIAPQNLDAGMLAELAASKARAARRIAIEKRIPKHLLYTKGWPHVMPTRAEAEDLAAVRREVGDLLGIRVRYTDADAVLGRYAQLMAINAAKEAAKAAKAARKAAKPRKPKPLPN